MLVSRKCNLPVLASMAVLVSAWTEPPTKLTPRELFYAASAPAAAPKQAASSSRKARPPRPAQSKPAEPASAPRPERAEGIEPVALRALGLRYSILKYASDGSAEETDAEGVFHTGDRIRLRIRVNEPGFLYVAHKGSSGAWSMLFPSEELDGGSNAVTPGRDYDLPGRTRLVFDETPGEERIFIILARAPEPEMDRLIYELDQRVAPARQAAAKTLIAEARIPDSLVSSARMAARDLVFEKVDASRPAPPQAGGRRETAVYVVNASSAKDARLVADITLNHR